MVAESDYAIIFETLESNLRGIIDKSPNRQDLLRELDDLKQMSAGPFDDGGYYRKLVHVVFFSGFKAEAVERRLKIIDGHFPDYQTVASYGQKELDAIAADPTMIRHKKKIEACRDNARTFGEVVAGHGSFSRYIESFDPTTSHQNAMRLRANLIGRFRFMAGVTSLHFLIMVGLPVLKPDVTVMRIFSRLGIIESEEPTEKHIQEVLAAADKMARNTGKTMRDVDIVFSLHGMMPNGRLKQGICLMEPECSRCPVTKYCDYYKSNSQSGS